MCSFAFTGCSLVQRNTERYLNRTVATAGEMEITKQELINAYNSYGSQYIQYYGYTAQEAVEKVLDEYIGRKILIEKAKDMIREEADGSTAYYEDGQKVDTIFGKNVWNNACWNQAYDSINEQIQKLEEKLGATSNDSEDEEATPDFKPYEEYEKKVTYNSETGKWTVVHDEIEDEDTKLTIADFKQKETGDEEISQKAFKLYAKQLELGYKKLNLSIDDIKTVTKAEFDEMYNDLGLTENQKIAFVYELERAHDLHEENKYVTTIETIYNQFKQVVDNDFNQQVVDYYKQLVEESYEKYMMETEEDAYAAYVKAMQDDPSKVYYHRDFGVNEKGEKKAFIAVSHVLIKLSDEQLDEIKELESKRDSGYITIQEYDIAYQEVLNSTVVYERDENGFEQKDDAHKKTVQEVYEIIRNEFLEIEEYYKAGEFETLQNNYGITFEEAHNVNLVKAVAFNKYLYMYGQDTGMINSSHYYGINLDTDVEDSMVKAFADVSRELAKGVNENLNTENIYGGNISEPVFNSTHNGFHIIFNAGLIENDASIEDVRDMDYRNAENLYNKRIMLGTNKTVYDYIYDEIYSSKYYRYQQSIIKTAKNSLEIIYYIDAYKDMFE